MSLPFLGWRCSRQDFRGWRERNSRERQPPVHYMDFATREEAEHYKRDCQASGLTACVAPAPVPKVTKARKPSPFDVNDRPFCADWKLKQ